MYVTRPLSLYRNPAMAPELPPIAAEGPNSGILVIQDEEAEEQARCCWGLCKDTSLPDFPFPQNRKIRLVYHTGGESSTTYTDYVYFVPAVGHPLSSNRYYIIRADGKHKGNMCTCSKEEDMTTCCFCCKVSNDVRPRPFDHRDPYQQFEVIRRRRNSFTAKSVASDGIPPAFLRRKYWNCYTSSSSSHMLGEARGVNAALRARMPADLESPPLVVGRWYCPYIFVKESNVEIGEQMKSCMFYEMTLVQFWEQIVTCKNVDGMRKSAEVAVSVGTEAAALNGTDNVVNMNNKLQVVDGVIWFKAISGRGVGLSSPVWERMRWEEARGGWVDDGEREKKVERVEVCNEGWKRFGCYVLVERFVLKRMDGSLAFTYDFKHVDKLRFRWE